MFPVKVLFLSLFFVHTIVSSSICSMLPTFLEVIDEGCLMLPAL
jgi:hypothetical protein